MNNSRVMMWLNYRRGPNLAVPAPFDDNSSPYWWYDRIAQMAHGLAGAGVTDVLFPNPVKGQSGAYRTGDGYNPFDDGDLGSKNQLGRRPTRFGEVEQLRRAIAICRANGINVHVDHVMHQRLGGRNGVYRYVGADGKTLNGRFPKDPGCFRGSPPRVPQDPVPAPGDDFAFGDELCPVNATPKGYVWNGLIEAGDRMFRTLGVQGARVDDTKGLNIGFVKAFMNAGYMKSMFFFGEYASGNRDDTNWWVSQVDGRASSMDFDFHYNVAQPMGNSAGSPTFDIRSTIDRGMMETNSWKAVPFVESMDSDVNGWASVVSNKVLVCARMLAGLGLPLVYIRDYLKEPDCYGLRDKLNNLMWCSRMLANGGKIDRHADNKVYVFERTGYPGLICALNCDVFNPAWKTVTIQTSFGPYIQLHDYTGQNAEDCRTDANGRVTFGIPPGANGLGYGMWSRGGMSGPIPITPKTCTQEFFGAADLDTWQAKNGTQTVSWLWADANTKIEAWITLHTSGWTSATSVLLQIVDQHGNIVCSEKATKTEAASISGTTKTKGKHSIVLVSQHLPPEGSDFTIRITYQAPQTISPEEF